MYLAPRRASDAMPGDDGGSSSSREAELDLTDPDSFLVSFDGENPVGWWYGCQTAEAAPFGSAWGWQPVLNNAWCYGDASRRMLPVGTHLLHLTNREAGNHGSGSMAAVTRVVVTSDPAFVP